MIFSHDSTLESLSNELLINLFQYIPSSDLFQSFFYLNIRFNTIIQSLNFLHLTISSHDHFLHRNLLSSYIHSLIIIGDVEIDLHQFPNLHRLILHSSSNQFSNISFPHLESLSIPDNLFGMSPIFEKIFSNQYPQLNYCHCFGFETIETIGQWSTIPSLRILKIGLIDYHVYKAILVACPNLYSLHLRMFQSYLQLSDIENHSNLRKLDIHCDINDWHYNNQLIDRFLACVIHLEYLSISRSISFSELVECIPDYDWFASIVAIRLPVLKQLIVSVQLEYHPEFMELISTETRRDLRKVFFNAHSTRYQSRFIIK